jgi:hypothetical protein
MIKRLLAIAIVALAALACSPSTGGSAEPSVGTPTEAPSMDASPSIEASPSAS